jgi:hypothetical protein
MLTVPAHLSQGTVASEPVNLHSDMLKRTVETGDFCDGPNCRFCLSLRANRSTGLYHCDPTFDADLQDIVIIQLTNSVHLMFLSVSIHSRGARLRSCGRTAETRPNVDPKDDVRQRRKFTMESGN